MGTISDIRARLDAAKVRAKRTTDPRAKAEWQSLADAYAELLATVEGRSAKSGRPIISIQQDKRST